MAGKGKSTTQGLRAYRQKVAMEKAVLCGDSRLQEVVYGYRFPSYPGRIKIGYSSRGLTRVAEQSTAFPEKPELVFLIRDKNARRIENAFHMALSDRQSDVMGTEWFDVTWRDVLSVSPHLRKATGAEGRRRIVKWVATAALGLLCVLLYPIVLAGMAGVGQGVPVSRIAGSADAYMSAIFGMDLVRGFDMARAMLQYAGDSGLSIWAKGFALVVCCTPLSLPWISWRRQAR